MGEVEGEWEGTVRGVQGGREEEDNEGEESTGETIENIPKYAQQEGKRGDWHA